MSKTLELIEKLAQRLDDPDRLDESRAAVMATIQALNHVLTPPAQSPQVITGKFTGTSEIQGLVRPNFTSSPGADISDSPDLPDLSPTPSSRPVMPQIEYQPRGPLGNLIAGLMNLGRGAADILPVAASLVLGSRQIETSGPTGLVTLTEQDALEGAYLAGVRRDKFGNILPPDDANLTEADRVRREAWNEAGGQGQFDTNLWGW